MNPTKRNQHDTPRSPFVSTAVRFLPSRLDALVKNRPLRTILASIMLTGCVAHTTDQAGSGASPRTGKEVAITNTGVTDSGIALYCNAGGGTWHRVLSQSDAGVMVDRHRLDFDAVWSSPSSEDQSPKGGKKFIAWGDLDVPLPRRDIRCWGYALTYPSHRGETLEEPAFRFVKDAKAEPNTTTISHRPHLDYELEIGILMHRDAPGRFGYFLANDLTDRGMQVEHYDKKNPAPGFGRAKSFEGSLRAGPLLAVGDASLWPRFTATLALNGEIRQRLNAADCNVKPDSLHDELFQDHGGDPWLVAATGTTSGTLFRVPETGEKIKTIFSVGFSMKRAQQAWLNGLRHLRPGDELVLESPILGRGAARLESK